MPARVPPNNFVFRSQGVTRPTRVLFVSPNLLGSGDGARCAGADARAGYGLNAGCRKERVSLQKGRLPGVLPGRPTKERKDELTSHL